MKRLIVLATLAAALLLGPAVPAWAAPKTGCAPTFEELTVDEATDYIWDRLLDPSAFGSKDVLRAVLEGLDRNGDGSLCMKVTVQKNPNAKWYRVGVELLGAPTEFMNTIDNTSNGSH